MSLGAAVTGRGSSEASSGKFRWAASPLIVSAATSWARAAISAVGKVPSQILDFFLGSRISDTHFPQFRIRTPRYTFRRFSPLAPPSAAVEQEEYDVVSAAGEAAETAAVPSPTTASSMAEMGGPSTRRRII
ncbi:unnamed protein product [Spirodela intermedia]|uniref:Uncharacterized protein n=1 Tax=Spirodela intermedia TaxID=51605 RepID=A0A7I8LNG8_SPIIN|nr:unnamed protein product [Spirodela intermedia]